MAEHAVRALAVITSLIVLCSFVLFTYDQLYGASAKQVALVDNVDLTLPEPSHRQQPRRFVDGAARTLLAPFAATATGSSRWGRRGVPTLVALLVYGVGLAFAARALSDVGRRRGGRGSRSPDRGAPDGADAPPFRPEPAAAHAGSVPPPPQR